MKLISLVAASVLVTGLAGCETTPRHVNALDPSIRVDASRRSVMAGESAQLVAHSMDLAGSGDIKWSVSPNVAKISVESKPGATAMFSADQPGTYVITAATQRPDGTWVTSKDIAISVSGNMASDK